MTTRARNRARFLSKTLSALILGAWVMSGSPALGWGDPTNYPVQPKPKPKGVKGLLSHKEAPVGTLGYGPPGPQPGFQGFGLGFGLNYGYGGRNALGVGSEGGVPYFGGPGYPHPAPVLRRIGGITGFPYFGGPGGPTPTCPNFFGDPSPLVFDQPVVRYEGDSDGNSGEGDFGQFSGMIPYPENTFAPFTSGENSYSAAGAGSQGPPPAPAAGEAPPPPPPPAAVDPSKPSGILPDMSEVRNPIGIDAEAVADGGSTRGLKITRVHPGRAAERSGLAAGDVIRSANGYVIEQPGNLEWIATNAAPDKALKLSVRTVRDGEVRVVTTQLR